MSDEKKHHDVRGPSTLSRLALCPGSANLIERIPVLPDDESDASIRGSAMHKAMENVLEGDVAVYTVALALDLGPGDIDDLSFAVSAVRELLEEVKPDQVAPELRVSLADFGVSHGTIDLALIKPFDSAHIVDYKFGRFPVSPAERNLQLAAYAVAVAGQYAVSSVTVHVVQPALGVRSRHTYADLSVPAALVRSILDESRKPDAPRIAGQDQCKFCPAAAFCPEAGGKVDEIVSLAPVEELSLSQLEDAMEKAQVVRAVIGKIEQALYSHLVMGGESAKWELSNPRKLRSWKDDVDLTVFPPEAVETKLKTPAAVEKLLSKEKYEEVKKFVAVTHSKPSIVPKKEKAKGETKGINEI